MKKTWYLGFILILEMIVTGPSDAYHRYSHEQHHRHHRHHQHHQHHQYYYSPHRDQCWRHPWQCAPLYAPPPLITPAPRYHGHRYPRWKKQLCRDRYWSCRDAQFSVNTCLEAEAGCLRE